MLGCRHWVREHWFGSVPARLELRHTNTKRLLTLCRFEGAACNVDINECVRGTSSCAANSTCINTRGGFECTCWAGYAGARLCYGRAYFV